jgi:dihydrofolate synthase/folylpolyglutamate synthase
MQPSAHSEALLDWLYSRVNYERQSKPAPDSFRLHTMRCLIERLGNPHLDYPVIHVAGTKGKGSVTAMIGQILAVSGRKSGVYISPHLESINQRILLNNLPISDEHLFDVLGKLKPVVAQLDDEARADDLLRPVTFFEIITAAALYYFSQQHVDAAVLEVGLGGRLDSTNICQPEVSVITSISFDHMQQLGNTLAEIAYEKAGIIKPGVPVISGVEPGSVEPAAVIERVAADRKARLVQLGRDFFVETPDSHGRFNFVNAGDSEAMAPEPGRQVNTQTSKPLVGAVRLDQLRLAMLGAHQRTNAAIAIAACLELNRQGWALSEFEIRSGLEKTWLPGRTEVIAGQPDVVLDIAHNPASISALIDSLHTMESYRNSKRRVLILAISRDKDARSMLQLILPHFDVAIFTAFVNNPRSRNPQELLALAQELAGSNQDLTGKAKLEQAQCHVCPTSTEAWELAQTYATPTDLICIAGSVFLIADLRPLVVTQN